jgi:hypothetical protein
MEELRLGCVVYVHIRKYMCVCVCIDIKVYRYVYLYMNAYAPIYIERGGGDARCYHCLGPSCFLAICLTRTSRCSPVQVATGPHWPRVT